MKGPAKGTSGSASTVQVVRVPEWARWPWLAHGFSTRLGGVSLLAQSRSRTGNDLNLAPGKWDPSENVAENHRRLLAALRVEPMRLVSLNQIHSDLIRVLNGHPEAGRKKALTGDGLLTDLPGLLLSVQVADCLPILLVDVRQRVVAALHCGWRGTVRRLAQKGVGLMKQKFGARETDLRAALGPGIRVCCYLVGLDVLEEFEGQFPYASQLFQKRLPPSEPLESRFRLPFANFPQAVGPAHDERFYLDLVQANVMQLQEAGIPNRQIYSEAPCTCCHPDLFFSYRRDGAMSGRLMGVVGIREQEDRNPIRWKARTKAIQAQHDQENPTK